MVSRFFGIRERGSTPGREVVAGATTFLTMAYIVAVNPDILASTGMDRGALITATILASAFGTLLTGLWANVPFAMAPGMGLNAFFAYSLVLGEGVAWQTALGVVFLSGVFFMLLTLLGVRRLVVAAIPAELRLAIAAGIGLFITFVGLRKLGLIVDDPATLVALGPLGRGVAAGLLGLVLAAVLSIRDVTGALLIAIVGTTALGVILGEVTLPSRVLSVPPSLAPLWLQMDVGSALRWSMWGAVFSFMFVDLFDSVGTVMACSDAAGLSREDGSIEAIDRVLEADAVATLAGAALGTSTTTTYIESGAGAAAGGRTGLANVVTAGLFLGALVITPLIAMVPAFATAPALIMVGVAMFRGVERIEWSRLATAVPAFLTIVLMPLTYSISMGLAFGFLAAIVAALASGRGRAVHPVLWAIGALSLLEIVLAVRAG